MQNFYRRGSVSCISLLGDPDHAFGDSNIRGGSRAIDIERGANGCNTGAAGVHVEGALRRYWQAGEEDTLDGPGLANFFFVAFGQRVFMGAITRDPVLIPQETPFRSLVDLAVNSPQTEFFVVQEETRYVGTISVQHLRQVVLDRDLLDQLIVARDMADTQYPVLGPEDNLDLAMKLFSQAHVDEIPVVSEGELIGSVRKADVLDIYNREVLRRDLSGGFKGALTWLETKKSIDLGEGYILAEVETPPHFVGKTLQELNVRYRFGVEVVLIKRS